MGSRLSGQRHAILRQTLELVVADGEDAWPLQQEARRIQAEIARLLERCCDELSAPDCLHRIDRLELDLGMLDRHRFAEDFLAKMGAALRDRLAAAISESEADGSSSRLLSQWELLSMYLRLGRLPWWADVAAAGQPQAGLAFLLREAPEFLRHGMAPLLADVHVLKRLAGHFADRLLAQLAAQFLPQLGSYPGALALNLIPAAPAAERSVMGGWRSRVWQSVFANAVAAPATASRLDYSRSVLIRLAAGRLSDYRGLIRRVQEVAAAAGEAGQGEVLAVLAQLSRELLAAEAPSEAPGAPWVPPASSEAANQRTPSPSVDFEATVRTEHLPPSAARTSISAPEPASRAAQGRGQALSPGPRDDTDGGALPGGYRTPLPGARQSMLLLGAADEPSPSAARTSTSAPEPVARTALGRGQAHSQGLRDDTDGGALPGGHRTSLPGTGQSLPLLGTAGEPSPLDRVRQFRQPGFDPSDMTDTDAIPVSNAGLVILWPFLKPFLERLDLLEGKGFKDEAARQRSAILLQCLASGEAEVPEYLLPLNKVLCGLPLDAPCEIDDLLSAEEIGECEQLLVAVIDQVPILNKMSVAGFRASFLLRAGMLDMRDGAWLLRVERETHDLVLERFPWGFQWVRLPWMDAPLQVEW